MQNTLACLHQVKDRSTKDPSIASAHLLSLITKLFLLSTDQLTNSDRDVFGDVLEQIAFSLESGQRTDLSHQLADQRQAPRNIVVRLARDEFAVAEPILLHSLHLTDKDLVFIVQNCSQNHIRSICKRDVLSDTVTDVIIGGDNVGALLELALNAGASFSQTGWERLGTHALSDDELMAMLELRSDRPPATASPEAAEQNETTSQQGAPQSETLDAPAETKEGKESIEGLVSEATLRKAAKSNNPDVTVEHLAVLVQQNERFARHCLMQPDINALIILCKAEELSEDTFAALLQFRLAYRLTKTSDVANFIKRYRDLQVEAAQKIIRTQRDAKG